MEFNAVLGLLSQGLPAIAEFLTAIQNERLLHLKHKVEKSKSAQLAQVDGKQATDDRAAQLQLAVYQRETHLQLLERQSTLEQWVLGLSPTQLLDTSMYPGSIPLQIFLAPLHIQQVSADQKAGLELLESGLAQGLATFLNQHYPLHNLDRPTELLSGAWRDHSLQREARIKALFDQLRDRPTLVLETDIVGSSLHIRLAYWGLSQKQYHYRTIIANLPWRDVVDAAMKRHALQWKETAQQLLALGELPETIQAFGGRNSHNLKLLEQETNWQQHGIDTSTLCLPYQILPEDFDDLNLILVQIYSVLSGWVTDVYYLLNAGVTPLLPNLMSELIEPINASGLESSLLQTMLSGYQEIFRSLDNDMPEQVAFWSLQLAHSLSKIPDATWAKQQVTYSLNTWVRGRQSLPPNHESIWKALAPLLKANDEPYLQLLKMCLNILGEEENEYQVDSLLKSLKDPIKQLQSPVSEITLKPNKSSFYQVDAAIQSAPPQIVLARKFNGHSGKAASLAFCNDGQTLITARENHTITLHHLQTGETLHTLTSKAGRILALSLSPDAKILASSHRLSDRSSIQVWHLKTGQLLHTLTGHHKWIYALAISPDSQLLVSGGHKIKIWNLQTGKLHQTLDGHRDWVYAIAISPDGNTLVSAGGDKTIKLWHLPTGKLLCTLTGHRDWVRAIALSADGQILASGSDDNTIRLWDLSSAKPLKILKGHLAGVSSLAISPDQQTLVSGGKDNTVRLWQMKNGTLLNTLTEHKKQVYSLAMNPDGKTFASGSDDKTILIWQQMRSA